MFVIGCHRSGTSLLASILTQTKAECKDKTAYDIPNERLRAQIDNPGGFQESKQLVQANELMLSWLGIDWQNPPLHPINWKNSEIFQRLFAWRNDFRKYALHLDWLDKDPRLCITYPAYIHLLLKRVPIAAIIRDPLEVCCSLHARDGLNISHGLMIWFLYNQHLSKHLNDSYDVLIAYQDLLDNKNQIPSRLSKFLCQRNLKQKVDETFIRNSIANSMNSNVNAKWYRSNSLISQDLWNMQEGKILLLECQEIYKQIIESDCQISKFRTAFSNTPETIREAYSIYSFNMHRKTETDLNSRQDSEKENTILRSQLEAIKQSTSWKITAPVRWLAKLIKV